MSTRECSFRRVQGCSRACGKSCSTLGCKDFGLPTIARRSLSNDTSVYPEPQIFRPERHLRPDGSFTKSNELPTWGFGGRKCSAYLLAENTLFINIATLLWAFDFVPPIDENGEEILPTTSYAEWEGIIPW